MNKWEKYKWMLYFLMATGFWCISFPKLVLPLDTVEVYNEDMERIEVDEDELLSDLYSEDTEVHFRFRLYEMIKEYFEKD